MKLILQSTLRSLGITEKYAGFSLAVTAISLCFERPSRLRSVTKEVYWETAELHGCNRSDVERNIRTVIHHAWKVNRPGLQALSEYPLLAPPSVSDHAPHPGYQRRLTGWAETPFGKEVIRCDPLHFPALHHGI